MCIEVGSGTEACTVEIGMKKSALLFWHWSCTHPDMENLPQDLREALQAKYSPEIFEIPINKRLFANEEWVRNHLRQRYCHGNEYISVTPLVELISITLSNGKDDRIPYEIYGSIQIVDGEGAIFDVYNRTVDVPQTICNGDSLMLSMPKGRTITPSGEVTMNIALRCRKDSAAEDIVFITASHECRVQNLNEYDLVKRETIRGVHGSAVVEYVTYKHANFVTLEVVLQRKEDGNKEDGSCTSVDIYGSIFAHCGDNSLTLFDKEVSESVTVEYGSEIELSRAVIVVPAWGSLRIDVNLWNRDTHQQIVGTEQLIAGKDDQFPMMHYGWYIRNVEGEKGLLEVEVQWRHAYMQPLVETSSVKNIDKLLPLAKKPRVNPDVSRFLLSDLRKSLEGIYFVQLEVFSISIHDRDKGFSIWGTIKALHRDEHRQFFLFDRDKASSEILLPNQNLSITYHTKGFRSLSVLSLYLDLEDVDGRKISYGFVRWFERLYERHISWFDKKLCSIVRGDDNCYAAVHYSIFNAGVQAIVKINLIYIESPMKYSKLYGCIHSEYTKFEYFTLYDQEFYRRKLYIRRIGDPSLQYSETTLLSTILLVNSCVAVPSDSALIVDVNLKAISQMMDFLGDPNDDMFQAAECLQGRLMFSTQHKIERGVIEGKAHRIEVFVEWSKVVV